MRRAVVLIAVILTALLLQTTSLPSSTLLGIKPELLYLVTVVFAALRGPEEGACRVHRRARAGLLAEHARRASPP